MTTLTRYTVGLSAAEQDLADAKAEFDALLGAIKIANFDLYQAKRAAQPTTNIETAIATMSAMAADLQASIEAVEACRK